jgi:hypothetical protein
MSTIPELEAQLQTHLTTNIGRNAPMESSSAYDFQRETRRLQKLIAAAKEREQRDKAVAATAAIRIKTDKNLGAVERDVARFADLPVPARPTGPRKTLPFGTEGNGGKRKRNQKNRRKTRKTRKTSRR